jgi:hypothetical protein
METIRVDAHGTIFGLRYRTVARALVAGMVLLAIAVSLQPWGLRWDFAQVYDTGHRVRAGEFENLYESTTPIEGQPPLGVMRFWSTPLAGLLYAPLSALPPTVAMRVFKLQNVVAYALGLVLLLRYYLYPLRQAPETNPDLEIVGFLSLVVLFQPFWTVFLVGGQTTPTVFLLLVAFVITHLREKTILASAALTMVRLLKPAFVLMLPVFAVTAQWRLVGWSAAWLAASGAVSLAIFGWAPNIAFLANAAAGLEATRLWVYNSSLPALVHNFRLLWIDDPEMLEQGRALLGWIALGLRGGVAALLFYLWWRDGRGRLKGAAMRNYAVLMSLVFFLLASETIWEHYVTVLFIPAAYVLARRACFSPGALRLIVAALLLCAAQNLYVALTIDRLVAADSVVEIVLLGLYKSGPLLVTLWFVVRYHEEFVRSQPRGL